MLIIIYVYVKKHMCLIFYYDMNLYLTCFHL